MKYFLNLLSRTGDKAGALGAIVSAMGCAMCFPAIASLGAAFGMSFLHQWEGLFVNTLFPIFAAIALIANALGWFSHHQWLRSVLGMIGPTLVLLSLYPWFQYGWSTYVTYTGLALMFIFAIWDLWSPANRRCDESCSA
ncbi:MAG: organomercurial transporter MerC [gamma proteobacterium symbiont of Bathyaustriella thionipta]|nr:organomercurial transporter MerC [gamma proteobacterium symbiont of Bathyaustriella thionipta]